MEKTKEFLVFIVSALAAYFDTTITFVYALLLGFAMNVLAGLQADRVHIKMIRFPFLAVVNFKGSKFKDSLAELAIILFITYSIKGIVDLMKFDEKSVYAVQTLIAIAVYYYVRNSLRNLKQAYPKNRWVAVVYYLVSFKFRDMMPAFVGEAIDMEEQDRDERESQSRPRGGDGGNDKVERSRR